MGKKADSGQIFQRFEIDYEGFVEFCRDNVRSGDWIIDIGRQDTSLVNIYRRQDEDLVQKDPRRLAYKDQPEKKGLRFKILQLIDKSDKWIEKLSYVKVELVVKFLQGEYDKIFKDKATGIVPEIDIIIPIWSNKGTAQVITLIGRVNLIFV